jgi:hypothetical protein
MKNVKILAFIFILLLGFGLGCKGSMESPEVQARIDFARNYEDQFFIRRGVSFRAEGKERKTLEVIAISSRAQGDMELTIELLVSDKLKQKAKALGFEQIVVKAIGDSWMDGSKERNISLK